jgi:hypothetical protein
MRLGSLIKAIVNKTKAKVLIATHEGHSWERLVFYSARQVNPSLKCIGYIHAPLFQKQHAVKRSLAKDYNPDIIFTSGYTQKSQLERTKSLKNITIEVLGTSRCFGVTAKSHELVNETSNNCSRNKTCLVIPEGIESEIHLLFKFSLECAQQFPYTIFVWRLHPLFSFDSLCAANKIYRYLPDNIVLSDRELNQDLGRCDWVLYRGSSTVIQAIVAGLQPIYLHVAEQMKIDPLYEIDEWKMEIETINDFSKVMNSSTTDNIGFKKSFDYCLSTHVPFDYRIIKNILK